MPIKGNKIHVNDVPWMTDKLKFAMSNRRRALNAGNKIALKYYRNLVNSERKQCRQSYFLGNIKSLK